MIDKLVRDARSAQRRAVALGMASAALAALAAVALLAVSGWFLAGAAIAGAAGAVAVKAFNYLIPSAAIRGLAIVRTLSRYGERLFSHRAMLFALAEVRTRLFARLVAAPPAETLRHDRGEIAARLGEDVQALEEALLRTTLVPSGVATLAGASALILLAGSGPAVALLAAAAAAMEIVGALVRLDLQRWKSRGARVRLDAMFPQQPAPPTSGARPAGQAIEIMLHGTRHLIEPGARAALTGASGSGKTRLLETLAGLRDDAPEPVAIGCVAAAQLPLAVRRELFALAAQDATMIAGSVADNLALARPGIDRAAMAAALAVACADDVVAALPGGLDCWLGEDGVRLSGGQRKRLSLARALLAGRPYLLLDEPSEGLDAATEARLVVNLDAWLAETGTGLILVSHRPAMLALAVRRLPL